MGLGEDWGLSGARRGPISLSITSLIHTPAEYSYTMRATTVFTAKQAIAPRHVRHARTRTQQRGAKMQTCAFFNFNNNNNNTSQTAQGPSRADYDEQEVEDYFNYMGMLAAEGNYDRLEEMNSAGLEPVDLLLLMACSEDDTPKVEELLMAGADTSASSAKVYGARQPLTCAARRRSNRCCRERCSWGIRLRVSVIGKRTM